MIKCWIKPNLPKAEHELKFRMDRFKYNATEFAECISGCNSPLLKIQIDSVLHLGRLVCSAAHEESEHPFISSVVSTGILPRLIEFLHNKENNRELKSYSCQLLCNIATGNSNCRKEIVQHGAIPHLINLIDIPIKDIEIAQQATLTLSNIACESPQYIDTMIEKEYITKLEKLQEMCLFRLQHLTTMKVTVFKHDDPDTLHTSIGMNPHHSDTMAVLRDTVFGLHNLCVHSKQPNINVIEKLLKLFDVTFSKTNDCALLLHICSAIRLIIDFNRKDKIIFPRIISIMNDGKILKTSMIKRIVQDCLNHKDWKVQWWAIVAIRRMMEAKYFGPILLQYDIFKHLKQFLHFDCIADYGSDFSDSEEMRKEQSLAFVSEALTVIADVMCYEYWIDGWTEDILSSILDTLDEYEIFPLVCNLVKNGAYNMEEDGFIRCEAVRILHNASLPVGCVATPVQVSTTADMATVLCPLFMNDFYVKRDPRSQLPMRQVAFILQQIVMHEYQYNVLSKCERDKCQLQQTTHVDSDEFCEATFMIIERIGDVWAPVIELWLGTTVEDWGNNNYCLSRVYEMNEHDVALFGVNFHFAMYLSEVNDVKALIYFKNSFQMNPIGLNGYLCWKYSLFLYKNMKMYELSMYYLSVGLQINPLMIKLPHVAKLKWNLIKKLVTKKCGYSECGNSLPKDSFKRKRCKGCLCICYCNKICQKKDWKSGHKSRCTATCRRETTFWSTRHTNWHELKPYDAL